MGAPVGNQFWKNRSSHGRDKLFKSPELLWEAAKEYFQWCDDNPWYRSEQSKGAVKPYTDDDGKVSWPSNVAELPTARPYTIAGLCVYLDASRHWWNEFKKSADKDFLEVLTRIEEIIYNHKFEGAAVGAFNASIIARDLGLTEKSSVDMKASVEVDKPNYDNLSVEEKKSLLSLIRKTKGGDSRS